MTSTEDSHHSHVTRMMYFNCRSCSVQIDRQRYESWLNHLCSKEHQDKCGFNSLGIDMSGPLSEGEIGRESGTEIEGNETMSSYLIVVTWEPLPSAGKEINIRDIISKIKQFGLIENLIHRPDNYFAVVAFDNLAKDFLTHIKTFEYIIGEQKLFIRAWSDMADDERFTLFQKEMDSNKIISTELQNRKSLQDESDQEVMLDSEMNYEFVKSPVVDVMEHYQIKDSPASPSFTSSEESLSNRTVKTCWDNNENISAIDEEMEFFNSHAALVKQLDRFKGDLQLSMFLKEVSLTQRDIDKRHALLLELPGVLGKEFPDCVLYPFGSGYTGVGFQQDILYIYVDAFRKVSEESDGLIGPNAIGNQALLRIFHILKNSKYFCENVSFSSQNRIQFTHPMTGITCSLETKTFMKIQNSRLIKLYCISHPVVWPLCQLILYWSNCNELAGENGFEIDTIVCLVMFFLINQRILPSVTDLKLIAASNYETFLIQNYEASICTDLELIQFPATNCSEESPLKDVLELAKEFFHSFAAVQFDNYIVASGPGKMYPKYFYKQCFTGPMQGCNAFGRMLYQGSPMCVQDLLDDSLNITRKVSQAFVDKFQLACRRTAHVLQRESSVGAFNIKSIFPNSMSDSSDFPIVCPGVERAPFVSSNEYEAEHTHYQSYETNEIQNANLIELPLLCDEKLVNHLILSLRKFTTTFTESKIKANYLWIQIAKEFNTRVWNRCLGMRIEDENGDVIREAPIVTSVPNCKITDPNWISVVKYRLSCLPTPVGVDFDGSFVKISFTCRTDFSKNFVPIWNKLGKSETGIGVPSTKRHANKSFHDTLASQMLMGDVYPPWSTNESLAPIESLRFNCTLRIACDDSCLFIQPSLSSQSPENLKTLHRLVCWYKSLFASFLVHHIEAWAVICPPVTEPQPLLRQISIVQGSGRGIKKRKGQGRGSGRALLLGLLKKK